MKIVDFEPRHADAWRTLNEAWLTKYFVVEAKDREILDNPGPVILDKGGHIFMAERAASKVIEHYLKAAPAQMLETEG